MLHILQELHFVPLSPDARGHLHPPREEEG